MTPEEALPRLQSLLLSNGTHADYAYCLALRDYYLALATGQGLGTYLRRYEVRETEAEFAARIRLTDFITPAIWSSLRKPFQGVARLRFGVTRRFDYAGRTDASTRAAKLTSLLDRYYHQQPLEDYLSEELDPLALDTDPNAWLLTEFAAFDYRREQAQPYPVLIPCDNAIDFTVQGDGTPTSLTVRTAAPGGLRYTVYLSEQTVDAWPLLETEPGQPAPNPLPDGSEPAGYLVDALNYPTHAYRILTHGAGRLPARRIGFVADKRTQGRTRQSHLEPAVVYLAKTLKLGSEADITAAQVVHPHKAQYTPACPGEPGPGGKCFGGYMVDGRTCNTCHGTGLRPTQTGAGDVLELPYPRDAEPRDIVDLSKLVVWNRPPSDIVELQYKLLDGFEEKAHRAMFNSDILLKGDIAQTAAEYTSRKAEFNKSLEAYAANHSSLFSYHAYVSAGYADLSEGLVVVHQMPDALLPLTKEQLATLRETMQKSGAPAGELEEIDLDIARLRYRHDPEALVRFQLRQRIAPFTGQTNEEVLKLYALQLVSLEYVVRRFYVDTLLADIQAKQGPQWLYWTQQKQDEYITQEVEVVKQQLPASLSQASSGLFAGFTPQRVADTE